VLPARIPDHSQGTRPALDGAAVGRRTDHPLVKRRNLMNLFADAFDDMNALDHTSEQLTIDQRLKLAEVKALLSISQELSRIHHEGINPKYSVD
jgi:hypothetical protein